MKTESELDQDILNITMKIKNEFPELSKYIKEMPEKASGPFGDILNYKNLRDHYDSLDDLLKDYIEEHPKTTK